MAKKKSDQVLRSLQALLFNPRRKAKGRKGRKTARSVPQQRPTLTEDGKKILYEWDV